MQVLGASDFVDTFVNLLVVRAGVSVLDVVAGGRMVDLAASEPVSETLLLSYCAFAPTSRGTV